jgi:hypothetical protein
MPSGANCRLITPSKSFKSNDAKWLKSPEENFFECKQKHGGYLLGLIVPSLTRK